MDDDVFMYQVPGTTGGYAANFYCTENDPPPPAEVFNLQAKQQASQLLLQYK